MSWIRSCSATDLPVADNCSADQWAVSSSLILLKVLSSSMCRRLCERGAILPPLVVITGIANVERAHCEQAHPQYSPRRNPLSPLAAPGGEVTCMLQAGKGVRELAARPQCCKEARGRAELLQVALARPLRGFYLYLGALAMGLSGQEACPLHAGSWEFHAFVHAAIPVSCRRGCA